MDNIDYTHDTLNLTIISRGFKQIIDIHIV